MKRLLLAAVSTVFVLLGMALVANAQPFPDGNVTYFEGTADPVGTCIVGQEFYRTDTGTRFTCPDGSWVEYTTGGGSAYDGGSVTNPFLAPDGTEALPGFAFTTDSSSGCRLAAAGDLYCSVGAENALRLREQDADTMIHDFLSGHYATNEIGVRFQLDSGAGSNIVSGYEPDAFTIGWQLSTTDTSHQFSLGAGVASDTYAVNLYGLGTGSFIQHKETGVASEYTQLAFIAPTRTNVVTVPDEIGELPTYQSGTSTLTGGAATSILSFPLATGAFAIGQVHHNIYCDDTTDEVSQRCEMDFVCYNDGGTEECDFINSSCTANAEAGSGAAVISAATVTIAAGQTDSILMQMNAVCSLTETTLEDFWNIEFEKDGSWEIVTEQN